jgi:predicted secreted protein
MATQVPLAGLSREEQDQQDEQSSVSTSLSESAPIKPKPNKVRICIAVVIVVVLVVVVVVICKSGFAVDKDGLMTSQDFLRGNLQIEEYRRNNPYAGDLLTPHQINADKNSNDLKEDTLFDLMRNEVMCLPPSQTL